jgi:hypothetical protein
MCSEKVDTKQKLSFYVFLVITNFNQHLNYYMRIVLTLRLAVFLYVTSAKFTTISSEYKSIQRLVIHEYKFIDDIF